MRPALRTVVAAIAIGHGVLACSTLRVRSDFDRDVDFGRYESYAWLEEPLRSEAPQSAADAMVDPFAHNSLLDKRVRQAVDRELQARGYRAAHDEAPSFRVQYHVVLENRTRVYSAHGAYHGVYRRGYDYYGIDPGGVIYSDDYKEGTLIVDVIDARTGQIAWRGWAIGKSRDGYYDEAAVDRAVSEILAEFPPGGVSAAGEDAEPTATPAH